MSLYKRPNSPYWWTEIRINGRRARRSTGTASRREAELFERRLRDTLAAEARSQPKTSAAPVLTLDHAAGRYWIEHGRRLKAHRDEQRNLRYIVATLGKDVPLSELSSRHVNALVKARLDMGAGPAGVNRTVSTLKTMMNWAAKRWEEPVRAIAWTDHKQKEPKERVRWITPEEAQRLLNRLEETAPHIASVVTFLLLTGLRRDEAFSATWDRLDMDKAILTARVKGGHDREVPLSADAMAVVRDLPRLSRYIFDTTNWRKHFARALTEAAIENFRWHDLRHTYATWLGRAGAPIEVVSKALGHSSVTVTMKYRHVLHSEVRDAMQKLPTLGTHTGNIVSLKRR